jgi:predicted alpha-1,2-mannosidase
MAFRLFIILLLSCFVSLHSQVNPFIGTGGHGHTYPGASMPFGFMQLSPDTRLTGWDGCSGYHYSDTVLYGFSHTHLSGTGVSDYGDLLIMPYDARKMRADDKGRVYSSFSHQREFAEPGYYRVQLDDYNIIAELTAAQRSGIHHYRFNQSEACLVVDVDHRDQLIEFELNAISDHQIKGKRISNAWAKEQHFYFYMEFSHPFEIDSISLGSKRFFLKFPQTKEVYVRVGISAVDAVGARKNLQTELADYNFKEIRTAARQAWHQELSKIQIFSQNKDFKIAYNTALYHSFLSPNLFVDVDGRYRGTDLKIHHTMDQNYTVFSLWDTFRATHPLFTLVQQKRTEEFIRTFLRQFEKGGKLPMWELCANYTGCMIGYHAIPVIVDAYMKGLRNFDAELALKAMIARANQQELGIPAYREFGFIPVEEEHESVSKTLEYAYDDWCIAVMAEAMGKRDIANEFYQRSQYYKNLFNPANGFMQAKIHNTWQEPFDPREVNFNFTEANSWQYSFFAPHDIGGLIALHGGAEKFECKLDELFSTESTTTGREQVDITGLIGQYAHGNEPSHHMAFLYNYVGKPHKTQEKTRQIIREMYQNAPDGLSGNEDCGQMSSWLNLVALGIYPVNPGSTQYALTSPYVDSAHIQLENGKTFRILAHQLSDTNQYIQKIRLNGSEYPKLYIEHGDLMRGGKLEFVMGPQPTNWGASHPPFSAVDNSTFSIVPFFNTQKHTFFDTLCIEIGTTEKDQVVYYTVDGTTPTLESTRYESPICLTNSATIKAIAVKNGVISKVIRSDYYKIPAQWDITIESAYNSQYTAGGDRGIIDFQRGGKDFRTGAWQGYQGQNFKATVNLKSPTKIKRVGGNFIQDIRSWIWLPKDLTVWTSKDGQKWKQVAQITHQVPTNDYEVTVRELVANIKAQKVQYIRFEASYFGKIPEWHLGHGGEAFIFIDELIIE